MKLVFCPKCLDVVKIGKTRNFCKCLSTFGKFADDGVHIFISHSAVLMDISNREFILALSTTPVAGDSQKFTGHIVGEMCPIVVRTDNIDDTEGVKDGHGIL